MCSTLDLPATTPRARADRAAPFRGYYRVATQSVYLTVIDRYRADEFEKTQVQSASVKQTTNLSSRDGCNLETPINVNLEFGHI